MLIHEYQARDLFEKYGINVTKKKVFSSIDGVKEYVESLNSSVVIKAQVHTGGRGKAGGVKFAKNPDEALEKAKQILGMNLVTHQTGPQGIKVRKILIVPALDIAKEYYLAITIDRKSQLPVLIASSEGGTEIEELAEKSPEKIFKLLIKSSDSIAQNDINSIVEFLKLDSSNHIESISNIINSLYKLFIEKDCSIAEINPLILTDDQQLFAIDGKMNFDDNALYRQQDILELRDIYEEEPLELEANKHDLSYIKLDGNVGCMVNGAGLAMATMDVIKHFNAYPANFLDIGGTATVERVEKAFRILISDKNVKIILINIFGGIVRCNIVAEGIVKAIENIGKIDIPLVIRLSGTNFKEGNQILKDSKLKFEFAQSLDDAGEKIKKILNT